MDQEDKKLASDEIYCTSCGEPIKKEAEICPNCGVKNKSKSSNSGKATYSHDPSNYKTSVSGNWWHGIWISTLFWILILGASTTVPEGGSLGAFFGFLILGSWILMPLAGYFDMQYVRANSNWDPNTILWMIGFLVWIVNIVGGTVYLARRHEALGEP